MNPFKVKSVFRIQNTQILMLSITTQIMATNGAGKSLIILRVCACHPAKNYMIIILMGQGRIQPVMLTIQQLKVKLVNKPKHNPIRDIYIIRLDILKKLHLPLTYQYHLQIHPPKVEIQRKETMMKKMMKTRH